MIHKNFILNPIARYVQVQDLEPIYGLTTETCVEVTFASPGRLICVRRDRLGKSCLVHFNSFVLLMPVVSSAILFSRQLHTLLLRCSNSYNNISYVDTPSLIIIKCSLKSQTGFFDGPTEKVIHLRPNLFLLVMWLQFLYKQVSTAKNTGKSCERPKFIMVYGMRPIFGPLVLRELVFGTQF